MAGRKLATYVHVHRDGETVVYGPDDEVPAADAKLIADVAWEPKQQPEKKHQD